MLIRERRFAPAFLLVLAAAAGGCQSRSTSPAASSSAPAANAPAPASVSPDVWATVDGREIRRDDVEKAYRRTVQPGQQASDEESLAAKLNILDQVITEDLMLARAKELNIQVPDRDRKSTRLNSSHT